MPEPLGLSSFEKYIPSFSPVIRSLLEKGEVYKEWDRFVEETAYHVLAIGDFETRGTYGDFGRLMYNKYPCIGHNAFKDPWVIFFYVVHFCMKTGNKYT